MIGADDLGFANTAGVEGKFYPVIPPIQRVHQEGIVDTILVAYDEPETGEMIPVGRVITSPVNENGHKTSLVRGLVGDGVIYEQVNEPLRSLYAHEQPGRLVNKQEVAASMVLAHFGYEVKKKHASSIFTKILKKVR